LDDPLKILKRLSSLSLGERFRSVAGFAPSGAAFGVIPSAEDFGAG
jgi:hypothetical protein